MSSEIVALASGKLYALVNTFPLDGRVTSYPPDVRGFAAANSYLYVEGDRALFVESGFSIHERSLLEQLESLLTPSTTLSLLPPRIGEFDAVCNTRPIVDRFDVDVLYGPMLKSTHWVDFRPDHRPAGTPVGDGRMANVELRLLGGAEIISVDREGARLLDVFHPPLRLLVTHWVYDPLTRTLFTSDAFTHTWRSSERGPWVITSTKEGVSAEEMLHHLVGTKFWWLPGANTEPIRRGLAAIFDRYEIDVIAPSFGCILRGRDVVRQHYEVLQEVLAEVAAEPSSVGVPASARVGGGVP